MYQAYLLLKMPNDFTLAKARLRLAEAFPGATFTEEPASLAMETEDWDLSLTMNSGPEVLADSRHFAEQLTGVDDDQGIAACGQRVEIGSDVPDPDLEHFEKYQRVLDAMRTFEGAILLDPKEPCVL